MVSIRKFRIIVLVSNRIEYWSNYSIRNFEYLHITTTHTVTVYYCYYSALKVLMLTLLQVQSLSRDLV